MNLKQLKRRLQAAWQYFPLTPNALLCGAAAWLGWRLLYQPVPKGEIPSSFTPFVILLGKLIFWFALAIVLLSLISTLAAYAYYLWIQHKHQTLLQLEFELEQRPNKKNRLYLIATLPGALRPLLGFIKGRLWYDDYMLTDSFALLTKKQKVNLSSGAAASGKNRLYLPDIREYEIKGGFIYFQDMLHIFSLAAAQPLTGHFYQPPTLTGAYHNEVNPKKTETLDVRIDQLRRVEGEYLNYKDFENGDDIRRIVWKVYAKNRELIVRVPELYEPYASHLHLHASFYAAVKTAWLSDDYLSEMLNYYKNCVWTIYDTISAKDWEVRYIPDQLIQLPEQLSNQEQVARTITNSNWHTDKNLLQYFNPRTGAVLIISSFTDPAELSELLNRCDNTTVIYFIRTSRIFRSLAPLHWLASIIIRPATDRLSRLRSRWLLAPLRPQVLKREKELKEILRKSTVIWSDV